eukprot:3754261-Prymnesium_polylepis.1
MRPDDNVWTAKQLEKVGVKISFRGPEQVAPADGEFYVVQQIVKDHLGCYKDQKQVVVLSTDPDTKSETITTKWAPTSEMLGFR